MSYTNIFKHIAIDDIINTSYTYQMRHTSEKNPRTPNLDWNKIGQRTMEP